MNDYVRRLRYFVGGAELRLVVEEELDDFLLRIETHLLQKGLPKKFVCLLRELTNNGYALGLKQKGQVFLLGREDNVHFEVIYLPDPEEFCFLVFQFYQVLAHRYANLPWAKRRFDPYSVVEANQAIDEQEDSLIEVVEFRLEAHDNLVDFYRMNIMFGATEIDRINPIPFLQRNIEMLQDSWDMGLSLDWQELGTFQNDAEDFKIKYRVAEAMPEMESITEVQVAVSSRENPMFMERIHNVRWAEVDSETIMLFALQAPDYDGNFEREMQDDDSSIKSALEVRKLLAKHRLNRPLRGKGAPSARLSFLCAIILAQHRGYKAVRMNSPEVGFPKHADSSVDALFEQNVSALEKVLKQLSEYNPEVWSFDRGSYTINVDKAVTAIKASDRYQLLNFDRQGLES